MGADQLHRPDAWREHAVPSFPWLTRAEFLADPRAAFTDVFLEQVWTALGDRHVLLMIDEAISSRSRSTRANWSPKCSSICAT